MCLILALPTTLFGVGFAGVILVVSRLQVGDGQMQITLGGGQEPVAEDFLNVPEIGLVLHQVRGASVPPQVAGDVLFDVGLFRVFFDQIARRVLAHGPVAQGQEQPVGLVLAGEFGPDAFDVVVQKGAGQLRQWHNAVFGSLPAIDAQHAFLKVHVIGANLGTSSAGGHGLSPLRSQDRTDK